MAQRSVFISYAREDWPEVEASADLLRAGGVKVFIDTRDIPFGDRWQEALRKALERCERVLVFWSLAARGSDWVEREWRTALSLGKRIVPMLLDATPLPSELQPLHALLHRRDRPTSHSSKDLTGPAPTPSDPGRAPASAVVSAWAVGAGLLALLLAGSAWWTLQRPAASPPVGAPAASTAAPGPAPSAAPLPAPSPGDPSVSSDALALLRSLPALVLNERSDELALRRAAASVGHLSDPAVVSALDPRGLADLAQASEVSLVRLQELQSMLETGRASFATAGERQAFELLLRQLGAAAPLLRQAATAAPPIDSPPVPGPPVADSIERLWPWLLLPALALAVLVARFRRKVPADARRFVREVFDA